MATRQNGFVEGVEAKLDVSYLRKRNSFSSREKVAKPFLFAEIEEAIG